MKNKEIKFEIQVLKENEFSNGEFPTNLPALENSLLNLQLGDLMIVSDVERKKDETRHLNESRFLLVDEVNGKKLYRELTKSPNGLLCIPLVVTRNLAIKSGYSFIQRYKNMFKAIFYLYVNSFKGIELDRNIDKELLPKTADLSLLSDKSDFKLIFFIENPKNKNDTKFDGEYLVWLNQDESENCFSLNDEFSNLKLDNSISLEDQDPVQDLENIAERDMEMEDYNKKLKNIYENDFLAYLKTLNKGDSLCATSLPTKPYCKDTFEDDMMNSTSLVFYFDSIDIDQNGNINAVVAYSFDKSIRYYFTPFLCDSYGPFYKITLLTCMYNVGRSNNEITQHFFLDLPVHLYNILDSD